METYVALLRGINVSGQKKIKMADLKTLFEELKFTNVRTYIQSGNVVFDTRKGNREAIVKIIEKGISDRYGFDVKVLLRTGDELHQIISRNPFAAEPSLDISRLYVTLMEHEPGDEYVSKLKLTDFAPDRYVVSGNEIFIYYSVSYSSSKLNNNLFENKLKLVATTRNWRTLNELKQMALEDR
jgi:uncharacterized protein (DUF1697 family)